MNDAAWYWCLAKCAMVAAHLLYEVKVSIDFATCFKHSKYLENEVPFTGIEPWTSRTLSDDLCSAPHFHVIY